ncbi:hypothetical protein ACH4TE_18905 [Streptomyces sioyaensis]|uniref:hypothetical protein n=1 Tax=Streptomyces sioyaensis TaxID=67364 RepID=UPI00379FB063
MSEEPTDSALPSQPIGVHLLVPKAWQEFDTHSDTADQSIREIVAERIKERPDLAEHKGTLRKLLKNSAGLARENNVVYSGAMMEVIDGDTMTASLTVSVSQAENEQTGEVAQTGLETLHSAMNPIAPGSRPTDPWRKVSLVELDDGVRAVRSEGIEDVELPDDRGSYRAVTMQTFVPYPGNDPKVAVITASTPQLALAEPMLQLFEAITATFRFVYAVAEGENTERSA